MEYEFVIVGGGMVGLSLANQLMERGISDNIIILDKEKSLGMHSSGRNSGVLHAGIYYQPNSLKAKVSVEGSRRLKEWVLKRGLSLNPCGKIIIPQRKELDPQLDKLICRGKTNGADVKLIDNNRLREIIPFIKSKSGRAIWSPNTCVVKPLEIINSLKNELEEKGIKILNSVKISKFETEKKFLELLDSTQIKYKHLINCAGLNSDNVAHEFGIGKDYKILPFKGLYWKLNKKFPFQLKTNLYPVPDLNVPFLGVHFTPSAGIEEEISIGPTAIPAFGRENYYGLNGIEPKMAIDNLLLLSRQYFLNKGGFRKYVNEQAFLSFTPLLLKAAKELVPELKQEHIEISKKVGIRAQLFNLKTLKLEDDFLSIDGIASTHLLNTISPAFTASFALADLIIDKIKYISNDKTNS